MGMALSTSEIVKRLVKQIDEKKFLYFHEFVEYMTAHASSVDYSVMIENAAFFEMYLASKRSVVTRE